MQTKPNAQQQKFCFVIPHYRHDGLLPGLLRRLERFGLPAIVVDDGSPAESRAALKPVSQDFEWVTVHFRDKNGGKGAAVIEGLRLAHDKGYSHVIQIDADGQHDTADVPEFLNKARQYPDSLVSGAPIFGADVPSIRLWGRKITTFWIHVELLSTAVPDGMCGYRVYPVEAALRLCDECHIGRRMDFDVDFLVRFAWTGRQLHFIPTRVVYPDDGISHFNMFKDNCLISLMHTRLVFGMIIRLPVLLYRKSRVSAVAH